MKLTLGKKIFKILKFSSKGKTKVKNESLGFLPKINFTIPWTSFKYRPGKKIHGNSKI